MLITPSYVDNLYDTKMTWGFGSVGDNNYLCIMVQSYTNHGRGGFKWSRESRLQPALYFFYKVLGNVKGKYYLCIVMLYSIVPHLIENKKFITSLNKKMKDRPFEYKKGNYGVDGYPQLKVVKGELVFKVHVSKGYIKYYRRDTYSDVTKNNSVHRRLSNRIRPYIKDYLFGVYAKHLGLKQYNFSVSLTWV